MPEPIKLLQVLLFRDPPTAAEIGPALWAACLEIEAFFNADERRFAASRYLLAPDLPDSLTARFGPEKHGFMLITDPSFWDRTQGKFSRTYDQRRLGSEVRSLLRTDDSSLLMILTDREITPPENSRYIIWDFIESGSVISTAPLDPKYWGEGGGRPGGRGEASRQDGRVERGGQRSRHGPMPKRGVFSVRTSGLGDLSR